MEILKIIAAILTPIAVTIIGVLLLRRIEGIKTSIAMNSDFKRKWADGFFACCQEFMVSLEREMAILTIAARLKKPNSELEIAEFFGSLSELELRIRRSVVFAPHYATKVKERANECLTLMASLFSSKAGNLDEIIGKMDEFNRAAKLAHAEMMGLDSAEPTAAASPSVGR